MNQITIELALNNTPDVPPFNNVQVLLSYDSRVLTAASLDYSTNVFTQTSFTQVLVRDCLDGHAANNGSPGLCGGDDGPGYVSFAESILGGATPDGTQGNIFFLTFNVNTATPGFSQIQISRAAPTLAYGNQPIPVTLMDGYYTSLSCGGQACQPAVAKFTWAPQPAKQGQITVFYGNASLASTGASITDYYWTFGDTSGTTPYYDGHTNSTAIYLYKIAGNYSVTLTITDSGGVKVSSVILVNVINVEVDMGIENLDVEPSPIGLHPGVVFTITAVLHNLGGLSEESNMTLTLTVAGLAQPLAFLPSALMKPYGTRTLTATWDSTGKIPNVYRLDFYTPILKNETKIDNNHKSYWIQLIPFQPAGSLSLLSVAGISVLVVGAGGFGVSFLRKRNNNVDDSL